MAILDTLIVQLLMDSSGIVKGVQQAQNGLEKTGTAADRAGKRLDDVGKKAGGSLARTGQEVEKTGESIEDVGKKGADSFAAFRREALGAIALFTGGAGIASFTHDIAAANTALGSLSRQLDIAPEKLTQLHEAMKASGGSASDVDGFFKSIQSKASTNEGLAQLTRLSQLTGVDYLDRNGRVRADIFDQLAHSQRFQGLTRGVQDNYIQQLGGNSAVTNLVDRHDYDSLQKRFAGLGPNPEQIRQGEQLLADWTELKANTDQVMQRVFSELEPTLHNFLQALIALEKAHPQAIADGIAGIASALSVLSALMTAKSFLRVLGMVTNVGKTVAGGAGNMLGLGTVYGVAKSVMHDVQTTGRSPWDTGIGELYAPQVQEHIAEENRRNSSGAEAHPVMPSPPDAPTAQGSPLPQAPEGVDIERLAGAVAMTESSGNPNAVNARTGAKGMFQFMDGTARENGVTNPFDPEQAWAGGVKYLKRLEERFHDSRKALAAYNWGPGNLDRDLKAHGDQWQSYLPSETSQYLAKVGRNYETGNVVHHNTTTHGPTINVAVNGGIGTPDDIRRMTRQGVSDALGRHETGKIG